MRWLLCSVALLAGCNADKIAQLERENMELRSKFTVMELQDKCSKQALLEFKEGGWDKHEYQADNKMASFTNHYNVTLNKCFMEVDYRDSTEVTQDGVMRVWNREILDAYERKDYAEFTLMPRPGKSRWETDPTDCHIVKADGTMQWRKSEEEFNQLIKQLMDK